MSSEKTSITMAGPPPPPPKRSRKAAINERLTASNKRLKSTNEDVIETAKWLQHSLPQQPAKRITNKNDVQVASEPKLVAFKSCPLEINLMIAKLLQDDKDVAAFQKVCRATDAAIEGDGRSYWRYKFLSDYDHPRYPQSNKELRKYYIERKTILGMDIRELWDHSNHHSKDVRRLLAVLRMMIIDSCCGCAPGEKSKNMGTIYRYLLFHPMVHQIFAPKGRSSRGQPPRASSILTTIQVVLAPSILHIPPRIMHPRVYEFPESQRAAYASAKSKPIIDGQVIDMKYILHLLNFWKFHLTRKEEATLYPAYDCLSRMGDDVRYWTSKLSDTDHSDFPEYWKGSYAFVDRNDIGRVRRGKGSKYQIQDIFAGEATENAFQDLVLELNDDPATSAAAASTWPGVFERILHSLTPPNGLTPNTPSPTSTTASSSSKQITATTNPISLRLTGVGLDNTESFQADGWLNTLPPQYGIPGWKRMTMMKYYYSDEEMGIVDMNALWAYEGVVLPGNQVIVGRWWAVDRLEDDEEEDGGGEDTDDEREEEMYSGPFLLWAVREPREES